MSYGRDVYAAAEARLRERRQKAEKENRQLRDTLYVKIPRLREIEGELADTGIRAAQEVLAFPQDSARRIEKLKKRNLGLQAERAELLTANGFEPDLLEPKYSCPRCRDTGICGGKLCTCFKTLLREEACRTANMGSPLPLKSFETFDLSYYPEDRLPEIDATVRQYMSQVFQYCKKYAEDLPRRQENLLLLGPTGLGKTHLALAIANRAIEQGAGVIYDTSHDILGKMEDEYFGRSEKKFSPLVFDCDLLILDDLGAEFSTSFNVTALYNIINTRTLAKKPMVISTNLAVDELASRYSERIVSRLIGEFSMLRFFGKDIRQLKLRRT